jgi:hypothetical protein
MRIAAFLSIALLVTAWPAQAQPQPPFDCAASEQHRQFDFWVGTWSVADASGKDQGENEIRKVQNGCALEEQWVSVRGGTGQSLNYYHPGRAEWHQLWTDGGASIIDIRGGLREGSMVLVGTIYYLYQSVEREFRGTWTLLEDGRVRQLFEEQDDKGVWKVWFEGFYTRS